MAKLSTVSLSSKTGFSFSSFIKTDWLSEDFTSKSLHVQGFGEGSKTTYVYKTMDGDVALTLKGTLWSDYSGSLKDLESGKLTDFTYAEKGVALFTVEGASVSWSTVKNAYAAGNTKGFVNALLSGDDSVRGTSRADSLIGQSGHDKLYGFSGNDSLSGGSGNDRLDGGKGADILTGGAGSDAFVLKAGYGRDTVADFTVAGSSHDIVDLSSFDVSSFSSLKSHMRQHGSDVFITFGADTLVIDDVKLASLKAAHFDL